MEKQEKLVLLKQKVCACEKCPELVISRDQVVMDDGNPDAQVVFFGEAPGSNEDKEGRPFVGRAGQLLDVMLENIGLTRKDIYIINTVMCHPEHNRNPSPEEATNCRPFLDLQLKIINPKILVCLGAVAAKNILKTESSLGSLRNRWHDFDGRKLLVTYHPAYLLRNPSMKSEAWKDFEEIKKALS